MYKRQGFFNPFPNQQSGKTVVGEKPSAQKLKILANRPKLISMLSNLNQYIGDIQKIGTFDRFMGTIELPSPDAVRLESDSEKLRLDLKTLYELGALVGGDFQILDRLLTNPNTAKGLRMGQKGLLQQLYSLENTLIDDLKNKGGFDEQLGSIGDPIDIKSEEQWKKARVGLYYTLPNGDKVMKKRVR